MSGLLISLPRYRCHVEVNALKIAHVIPNPRGAELHSEDTRFVPIPVDHAFVAEWGPQPGDYWVSYPNENGSMTQMICTAKAFEEGYALIDAGGRPALTTKQQAIQDRAVVALEPIQYNNVEHHPV